MTKQNFVIRAFQLSLPELNYGTQSFFNFPFRQSNTKSSEFDSNKNSVKLVLSSSNNQKLHFIKHFLAFDHYASSHTKKWMTITDRDYGYTSHPCTQQVD